LKDNLLYVSAWSLQAIPNPETQAVTVIMLLAVLILAHASFGRSSNDQSRRGEELLVGVVETICELSSLDCNVMVRKRLCSTWQPAGQGLAAES
jgi:hypothetical protein